MVRSGGRQSIVNLSEQFNRRSYVLNKTSLFGGEAFRVLYNRTQSYYTLRRGCEIEIKLRMPRMSSKCNTIEIDNRPIAVVHNLEIYSTGNINVTVFENLSNPHSDPITYLMPIVNLKRFMFQIFAIEQTKKRLVAQVNAISPGSLKLPLPDAYTFTVDIIDETNDKEIELILVLCIAIDEMRDYMISEDDDKEDFYNNN
jgi:hypothetical protein